MSADPLIGGAILDLPYPPSVNKIWKHSNALAKGKVYLSPSYIQWKGQADALLMATRGWSRMRVAGKFSVDIDLCPPTKYPRGDLDNRVKAVLDFLQRVAIVSDDKLCQRLVVQWVDHEQAPQGCRVVVRPWIERTVNDVLLATAERLEAQPM